MLNLGLLLSVGWWLSFIWKEICSKFNTNVLSNTLIHPGKAKTTGLVRKCCWVFLSIISQNIGSYKEKWGISLVPEIVKHLPLMWETWVWSLVGESPLEKEMATHSSILAWRILRTEDPGRPLGPMGSQRVRCHWVTSNFYPVNFTFIQLGPKQQDLWENVAGYFCQESAKNWGISQESTTMILPKLRQSEPRKEEPLRKIKTITLGTKFQSQKICKHLKINKEKLFF